MDQYEWILQIGTCGTAWFLLRLLRLPNLCLGFLVVVDVVVAVDVVVVVIVVVKLFPIFPVCCCFLMFVACYCRKLLGVLPIVGLST